ncbi:MAG: Calx-beta domain-containing protein [Planctomycetota bacterium]|jgi:hypothetical protein
MLNVAKVSVYFVVLVMFVFISVGSAELIDDFDGPQRGSWAPARWWHGRDWTKRGKFVIEGKEGTRLDIAFARARREKEIEAAGGFVAQVDVQQVRGRAAVCIGSKEFEKKGIAVVVTGDKSKDKDKLYLYGKAIEIGTDYKVGQKVRIDLNARDLEDDIPATISVYFDETEVVAEHSFVLQRSPQTLCLAADGYAVFDNLLLRTARPQIEFVESSSSSGEDKSNILIDVLLRNGLEQQSYSVGYSVSSKNAQPGSDYVLDSGTLNFEPGLERATINLKVNSDNITEPDEVVELVLYDPTDGAELGGQVCYTHTILGELPLVGFESPVAVVDENDSDVHVNVTLSHPCDRQVIVGYELINGTAKSGDDIRVPAGQLVFEPGQKSKSVTLDVVDDSDCENSINETAFVQLSAAKNCGLGCNNKLTVEIVDDEPWIEFDGSMWITGQSKHTIIKGQKVLSINKKGHLEWVCDYGDILYALLESKSTNKVGDAAEYGWLYKGDGQDRGSYVENICERYGSGDLRVALLDLGDKSMSLDRQYTRNDKMFCGARGYQSRLSPHVPKDARSDKWATRVTPNGGNCHSPVDWGGTWGFETYYNGHGVPVGEFTPMILKVERTTEDTIEYSVDMNNERHVMVDKNKYLLKQNDKLREEFGMGAYGTGAYGTGYAYGVYEVEIAEDYQPEKIDIMAMYFANQRPFDLITFAPLR